MCACGYPSHVCHHPENDGYFDVSTAVCYAAAAIEIHRSAESYKPDPGEQLAAVYTREKGDPLPLERSQPAPPKPDRQ